MWHIFFFFTLQTRKQFESFTALEKTLKGDIEGVTHRRHSGQQHLNASISGGVTRHRAGITLWGAPGDIWVQLQEGQMCCFDGKETCQLKIPAWQRWHIRWKTSPSVGMPLSFSKDPEGSSGESTCWNLSWRARSLRNLHWRILDCDGQNTNKGIINKASFIASSPSIKVRSYQSPPALLKCRALTGV